MTDFDYLAQLPGEEREQNWIRMRLGTLSVREGIVLAAAAQADPPENAVQAINQLQSLDEYAVCLDAGSYEALGRRYLLNDTRMPPDAIPFLDLEAVGRQHEDRHPGLFIGNCYVRYPETLPEPVYRPGMALPADDGWSVKLKVASPAVPEGVWLRLPGPFEDGCEDTVEEMTAIRELRVKRWDECSLVDARCVLPEAGDLMAQYSGNVADLIYDGVQLGFVLDEKGQGSTFFQERFTSALTLEGCQNLKLALDISQNFNCYDWAQRADLEASGMTLLLDKGVSEELIRASGIDLAGYRTMYDNLSTAKNYTLDASPTALGLASNEYVTEFMLVFGVVPANFRQVEAPKVDCKVLPTVKGGSQFTNTADVGGVYNGQWIQAVTRWTTKVYGKPIVPTLPKTGY